MHSKTLAKSKHTVLPVTRCDDPSSSSLSFYFGMNIQTPTAVTSIETCIINFVTARKCLQSVTYLAGKRNSVEFVMSALSSFGSRQTQAQAHILFTCCVVAALTVVGMSTCPVSICITNNGNLGFGCLSSPLFHTSSYLKPHSTQLVFLSCRASLRLKPRSWKKI